MRRGSKLVLLCSAAVVGLVAYFAGWAVSSPVGSSADETRHLASIWCGESGATIECPSSGGQTLNVRLPRLLAEGLQCMGRRLDDAANCQYEIESTEVIEIDYPGYDNYPGLYYDVARLLVGEDLVPSVLRIRVTNGALFALMSVFVLALSRSRSRHALIAMVCVLWAPVSFLVPSVNPSSWSITSSIFLSLSAVLAVEAAEVGRYRSMTSPVFIALVSLVMIAASRYDALLAAPAIVVLAAAIVKRHERACTSLTRKTRLVLTSLAMLSFVLLTILFRFLAVFNDSVEGPPRHHQTVLFHNVFEFPRYVSGFWGADPWNISAQQGMQVPFITQMLSAGITMSILHMAWKRHTGWPRRYFASACGLFACVVLSLHQSAMFYIPKLIQPRYFLPVVIGFIVVFVFSVRADVPSRLLRVVLFLTVLGQSVVLYQNFRRYVIGLREVGNDDLGCLVCSMEDVGWWWTNTSIPPAAVWGVATLGLGVALTAFYQVSQMLSEKSASSS